MPRRSVKKIDYTEFDAEFEEAPIPSTPRKGRRIVKVETIEAKIVTSPSTPKRIKDRKRKADNDGQKTPKGTPTVLKVEEESKKAVLAATDNPNQKKPAKRKIKAEDDKVNIGSVESTNENVEDAKPKKKRKTKEEKEAEAMPIAARTAVGTLKKLMYFGAHVSAAGGVQNSVNNILHIGGNSFALFLKSQRKWSSPPLAPEVRDQFKVFCLEHKYDAAKHVLPHGSYLVNLAQADPEKATQAYDCFLDDLRRCESLGIKLYNFHPGSTGPHPRPEAIRRIATQLNKAHKATSTVVTLLENMAGAGNVIGSTWEDLRDIITLVEDKSRVGVCLDTCHAFAAGHDLRSPQAFQETMEKFSSVVGLSYLKALHLNDSKAPFSSNRDLHANIGTGFLGLSAFHNVVNFDPFQGLPMVLETPIERKGPDGKVVEDKAVWATEIKVLESLIGADLTSEHFANEHQRLQDLGAEERKKFQGQADKKQQKTLDSMFKKLSPKKKKKKKKTDDDDDVASESDQSACNH